MRDLTASSGASNVLASMRQRDPVVLALPWPPSVNRYWRHIAKGPAAGRTIISAEGRQYRREVGNALVVQQWGAFNDDDLLRVSIVANPPDNRRRDLDNIKKAIFDSLAGQVYEDDAQIRAVQSCMGPKMTGGRVLIMIEQMSDGDIADAMANFIWRAGKVPAAQHNLAAPFCSPVVFGGSDGR